MSPTTNPRRPHRRRHSVPGRSGRSTALAGALALLSALALSACATNESSSSSTASSQAASASGACGQASTALPSDPDGVLSGLSSSARSAYFGGTQAVQRSVWSDLKPHDGPIKVGFSSDALAYPWLVDLHATIEEQFAAAKAKGLVTGSLISDIAPNASTQTVAQQISGYQSLVRQGVDVILLHSTDPNAMAPAITAAGKQGIPTVVQFDVAPSPYAINFQVNAYQQVVTPLNSLLKQIGGKGDVLIVQGVPGQAYNTATNVGVRTALKACPNVKVVGDIPGNYASATAKTAVLQWLSTHPGVKLSAVLSYGLQAPGIISAFQQQGKPVPPVLDGGAASGSLAYWAKNKPAYQTAGTVGSGVASANFGFDVAMRVLAGKGLKVGTLNVKPIIVTSDNVGSFVSADTPLNAPDEPSGPLVKYDTPGFLDGFFAQPGSAGGSN